MRAVGAGLEAEGSVQRGQLAGLDECETQLVGRLVVEVDGGVEFLAEQVGHHPGPARPSVGVALEHIDPVEIAGPLRPALEVGGRCEAHGRHRLDPDIPGTLDGHWGEG